MNPAVSPTTPPPRATTASPRRRPQAAKRAAERLHRGQALGLLAVVHEEDVGHGAGLAQGGQQPIGVAVGDGRLADDGDPGPALERRGHPAGDARPHHDVVAAGAELDPDAAPFGDTPSAGAVGGSGHPGAQPVATRTALAAWPGERPAVSTRTWAVAR